MATSENGDSEQLNAADQAKRDYDTAMGVVRDAAAELGDMASKPDVDYKAILTTAALGSFAAATAQAAATRLQAEIQADATRGAAVHRARLAQNWRNDAEAAGELSPDDRAASQRAARRNARDTARANAAYGEPVVVSRYLDTGDEVGGPWATEAGK